MALPVVLGLAAFNESTFPRNDSILLHKTCPTSGSGCQSVLYDESFTSVVSEVRDIRPKFTVMSLATLCYISSCPKYRLGITTHKLALQTTSPSLYSYAPPFRGGVHRDYFGSLVL